MYNNKKHPEWFMKWQKKFYKSDLWINTRDQVRDRDGMTCCKCKNFIYGKSIVDHIIEMNPENYLVWEISLNPENLQLLCMECHNKKTFEIVNEFNLEKRKDVNLF